MKKLVLSLLLVVLLVGCSNNYADEIFNSSDMITFPELDWGMTRDEAQAALNVDDEHYVKKMIPFTSPLTVVGYEVMNHKSNGKSWDLLLIFTNAYDDYGINSLTGIHIMVKNRKALTVAIERCNELYGAAEMYQESDYGGNTIDAQAGWWQAKWAPRDFLGDRFDAFSDYTNELYREASLNSSEFEPFSEELFDRIRLTEAKIVVRDTPDENGYYGNIQLAGGWAADVNRYLNKV